MEPPRNLITRILEACIALAVSGFLIKTAVAYVWSVKLQILIIAAVIIVAVVIFRIIRYLKNSGRWRDDT